MSNYHVHPLPVNISEKIANERHSLVIQYVGILIICTTFLLLSLALYGTSTLCYNANIPP